MNKELEALERLVKDLPNEYKKQKYLDISVLTNFITPPTVDEIVKGLNELEYGKWELKEIGNKLWGFVAHDKELNVDWYVANDNYGFTTNITLPLKLAHKITSFFMAEEK